MSHTPSFRAAPPAPRMVTVLRWIDTPVCRRRVEIDVHDFLLSEADLAAKYGVPWTKPVRPAAVNLASAVLGLVVGIVVAKAAGYGRFCSNRSVVRHQ
jgi:hypothetical protein